MLREKRSEIFCWFFLATQPIVSHVEYNSSSANAVIMALEATNDIRIVGKHWAEYTYIRCEKAFSIVPFKEGNFLSEKSVWIKHMSKPSDKSNVWVSNVYMVSIEHDVNYVIFNAWMYYEHLHFFVNLGIFRSSELFRMLHAAHSQRGNTVTIIGVICIEIIIKSCVIFSMVRCTRSSSFVNTHKKKMI